MSDTLDPLRQGLPPVAHDKVRLLVLGSLPGEASLAAQAYYAHPRNGFWSIMGSLIGQPALREQPYPQRLQALLEHDIGLWDVIGTARRKGSLDQHLSEVEANPLTELIQRLPKLEAVAFNGSTAYKLGHKQVPPGLTVYALPSTSPAHTLPLADKLAAWRVLAAHISAA
jgi:hypoxanthine-DNA glycosylase